MLCTLQLYLSICLWALLILSTALSLRLKLNFLSGLYYSKGMNINTTLNAFYLKMKNPLLVLTKLAINNAILSMNPLFSIGNVCFRGFNTKPIMWLFVWSEEKIIRLWLTDIFTVLSFMTDIHLYSSNNFGTNFGTKYRLTDSKYTQCHAYKLFCNLRDIQNMAYN